MAVRGVRIALLVALTVVLAGLATAGTWAVAQHEGWGSRPAAVTGPGPGWGGGPMMGDRDDAPGAGGYGPGMMGGGYGYGPGMMGGGYGYGPGMKGGGNGYGAGMMGAGAYGLAGDGRKVDSLDAAGKRAQALADRWGLRAGEVMQFSNGFYVELTKPDGAGATEVLVDPGNGAVGVEYGPAMMWNTAYGMHPADGDENAPVKVSAQQSMKLAQQWLDQQRTGLSAAEPKAFPGYYTLHTLRGGKIVGMLSVNASTGAVWYHTWHGTFITMREG